LVEGGAPPYFFLSYASGDDDPYVERLFRDLSREVRVIIGARSDEEVGFLAPHSIGLGADWSAELVTTLSNCWCFLAVCSRGYFRSESCCREWTLFSERLDDYERRVGVRPSALLPLVWLSPTDLHPLARRLQYHTDALGADYKKLGLRSLMRYPRNRGKYLEVVSELAKLIVQIAELHRLPPRLEPVEFDGIRNAFLDPAGREASQVHIVVATSSREEMRTIRANLEFYGSSYEDWAPYRPRLERISAHAQQVARQGSFDADTAGLAELPGRLAEAARKNQVVILLVDKWTTRMNRYRTVMADYDQRRESRTTAVMVPSSSDDQESNRHSAELDDEIRDVFRNNVARGDTELFQVDLPTLADFDVGFQRALTKARSHIFATGTVHSLPQGPSLGDPPRFETP